ncbi:MAG: pantetheine-phosphate adenylyltransferase [Bryobacterales bacterium]|nr:pantetheine-phosphate adenylyltransferase [Bryobacterales bacterium]
MARSRIAIYPGSFDPITNGHLDLIHRASSQFEELVVAVLRHDTKAAEFPLPERLEMIRGSVAVLDNVRVASFDGLLVDFARHQNAGLIVRGIRAVSDYEYELQMALMNRKLAPEIETVFMLPGQDYGYLSSRLVKEICGHGGEISDFVPPHVADALRAHCGGKKGNG